MIPAGTGIRNYRNIKLFDGSDKDLDIQMAEILERRRIEKEQEALRMTEEDAALDAEEQEAD